MDRVEEALDATSEDNVNSPPSDTRNEAAAELDQSTTEESDSLLANHGDATERSDHSKSSEEASSEALTPKPRPSNDLEWEGYERYVCTLEKLVRDAGIKLPPFPF